MRIMQLRAMLVAEGAPAQTPARLPNYQQNVWTNPLNAPSDAYSIKSSAPKIAVPKDQSHEQDAPNGRYQS